MHAHGHTHKKGNAQQLSIDSLNKNHLKELGIVWWGSELFSAGDRGQNGFIWLRKGSSHRLLSIPYARILYWQNQTFFSLHGMDC